MSVLLAIGATDSSGGAGLSADLETFNSLGDDCLLCVTAVTAQSNSSYIDTHAVPSSMIDAQLRSIGDQKIDAVKIGMLPNTETIEIVSDFISQISCKNVVLDPVMRSSSGGRLFMEESIESLQGVLFPHITLITPNLAEANTLTKESVVNFEGLPGLAKKCIEMGVDSVLIKGGHISEKPCRDLLFSQNQQLILENKRISGGTEVRGTGCRLASAIAHYLANEEISLECAVKRANNYLHGYILDNV
jgi:hydroxymethylpyrimidine/phosphomethylpyrimidine kinase